MSSRISDKKGTVPFLLLIAGCGGAPEEVAQRDEAPKIACALQGVAEFSETCALSQSSTARGTILTLSAPDGGFRRLLVTNDGQGVIAADGAEPAVITPFSAGAIEVSIGGDRYRLPASVK